MSENTEKKKVGIYIFENLTMMDAYAPLQFFCASR